MKILPGRIRADQTKHVIQNTYCPPKYYYDKAARCVDCKTEFIFTKEEQRVWYEQYEIPHHADRCRCKACGKIYAARQKIARKSEQAHEQLKTDPENAAFLAECGKTIVLYHDAWMNFEKVAPQKLEVAVGMLKRSLKLTPSRTESIYWIARCYELLNRRKDAILAFTKFSQESKRRRGIDRKLLKDAENRLAILATGDPNDPLPQG